ncbi:MAG: SUMF1/EgtB/PvdO family nonheme iron enzyme [Pirellulales bacterium]
MNRWHWQTFHPVAWRAPIVAIAAVVFVCGLIWQHAGLLGGGAALLCFALRRVAGGDPQTSTLGKKRPPQKRPPEPAERHAAGSKSPTPAADHNWAEGQYAVHRTSGSVLPKNTDALVDELLATGRYALLLRPITKQHLSQTHIMRAIRHLDEAMALVPAGRVLLGQLAEQSSSACGAADVDPKLAQRNLVQVDPAYLDRFCVTNEQYQQFVDGGGYEQLEFWHEEALPALLDFVDQSGAPGPRHWLDGQHLSGEQRLPVVGVSWYEACAYARWVGKRLPTDAEWTKAGAWPVEAAPGRIAQRRYPWGESFDVRRAHLYGSGLQRPVAVDEYPGGVSVGGIHQLIGNVWEWTATPLAELGDATLHVSESVISIRGGSFDTYFENQATCHYQSGEQRLSRRPNIGFRLALAMSDLEADDEQDRNELVTVPVTEQLPAEQLATI